MKISQNYSLFSFVTFISSCLLSIESCELEDISLPLHAYVFQRIKTTVSTERKLLPVARKRSATLWSKWLDPKDAEPNRESNLYVDSKNRSLTASKGKKDLTSNAKNKFNIAYVVSYSLLHCLKTIKLLLQNLWFRALRKQSVKDLLRLIFCVVVFIAS